MSSNAKVLVVGTTADYIEWIRQVSPGTALFLTDYSIRQEASEPDPHRSEEILTDLDDAVQVKEEVERHLLKWNMALDGIACFDCESMELAATLAAEFGLPYPTVESIRNCRDKYVSKTLWRKHGVNCPRVRLVQSAEGLYDFLNSIDGSCVVKPLSGSGSELVFRCASKKDCDKWATVMQKELKNRQSFRLYSNATSSFLAEEYVEGDEYSCDFVVSNDTVRVIRLTRKIHARNKPFGTIAGYALESYPPEAFDGNLLEEILLNGAKALGMDHAICMVDFLVSDNDITLLEMTPRPGGDCIPHLLRRSGGMDMVSFTLAFARRQPVPAEKAPVNGRYVGLRLHARKAGRIARLDTGRLEQDPGVKEIHLIRRSGHVVTMPPADYESWYLGYVIFQPDPDVPLENQCHDLGLRLGVELE